MQIPFETRKRNTWFYILRQGVPEGRECESETDVKTEIICAYLFIFKCSFLSPCVDDIFILFLNYCYALYNQE